MKKTIIILSILVIILIGVGVWLYLLLGPSSSEPAIVPVELTTGTLPTATDRAEGREETTPFISVDQALTKLTTRPVAGATFVKGGIRYAERGTGHIYEIIFADGSETRVSGTTIPRVIDAIFSASGRIAALTFETNNGNETIVGTITKGDDGEDILDGFSLPIGAREVAFSETLEEDLFYLVDTADGSAWHVYDVLVQTNTILFSIPLRDVRVLWGSDTYVYTTPSAEQRGYIYKVNGNELEYMTNGASGLMGIKYNEGVVISKTDNNSLISTAYEAGVQYEQFINMFPEKCAASMMATSTVYCSAPPTLPQGNYPDDWYKGLVSFNDFLWKIDLKEDLVELLTLLEEESGQQETCWPTRGGEAVGLGGGKSKAKK